MVPRSCQTHAITFKSEAVDVYSAELQAQAAMEALDRSGSEDEESLDLKRITPAPHKARSSAQLFPELRSFRRDCAGGGLAGGNEREFNSRT